MILELKNYTYMFISILLQSQPKLHPIQNPAASICLCVVLPCLGVVGVSGYMGQYITANNKVSVKGESCHIIKSTGVWHLFIPDRRPFIVVNTAGPSLRSSVALRSPESVKYWGSGQISEAGTCSCPLGRVRRHFLGSEATAESERKKKIFRHRCRDQADNHCNRDVVKPLP